MTKEWKFSKKFMYQSIFYFQIELKIYLIIHFKNIRDKHNKLYWILNRAKSYLKKISNLIFLCLFYALQLEFVCNFLKIWLIDWIDAIFQEKSRFKSPQLLE